MRKKMTRGPALSFAHSYRLYPVAQNGFFTSTPVSSVILSFRQEAATLNLTQNKYEADHFPFYTELQNITHTWKYLYLSTEM